MPTRSPVVSTSLTVLVPLVLAACGDSPASTGPYTLTFTTDPARTALLVAQDGDGPWLPVTLDAAGNGTFEVTAGYHGVAQLCLDGAPTAPRLRVTFDAGAATLTPCPPTQPASAYATLSGTVKPADAEVSISAAGPSFVPTPGTYSTRRLRGSTVDVVARAGQRMHIVRDVVLDADRVLDLDLTTSGFALSTVTLPPVSGATGTPTYYAELMTGHRTWLRLPGNGTAVPLVPAAHRAAGDRVVVGAYTDSASGGQAVQREVGGDTPVALTMATPVALSIERSGGRWEGAWEWIYATHRLTSGPVGRLAVTYGADGAWAEARGDSSLPWLTPSTLPGWDATWGDIVAGAELQIWFSVERGDRAGDFDFQGAKATLTW